MVGSGSWVAASAAFVATLAFIRGEAGNMRNIAFWLALVIVFVIFASVAVVTWAEVIAAIREVI